VKGEVELPAGSWRNRFTGTSLDGGRQPVADVVEGFGVALLVSP
jgi:maltooligosyltrehalose synthase